MTYIADRALLYLSDGTKQPLHLNGKEFNKVEAFRQSLKEEYDYKLLLSGVRVLRIHLVYEEKGE